MQASATEKMALCAFCGLPVRVSGGGDGATYCCHACKVVAALVGRHPEAKRGWDLFRLAIGTLLAMNVMMLSLLLYAGSVEQTTVPVVRCILLALSAPALAILLPPFLRGAAGEVAGGGWKLDTLISIGSLAAFGVSARNTIAGSGQVYFDTATMLPVLVTFGKFLESTAKSRAGGLLHALKGLLPPSALRLDAAGWREVPLEEVRVGDLVRVRPGERVAVDGIVEEGRSVLEEAPFTGEFLPRLCTVGDRVSAGTVNGDGVVVVRAEKVFGGLLLQRIVALVEEAWRVPSPAQRAAERAATFFIPLVVGLAALSFLAWWACGDPAQGGISALSVLVVACPCTMGIATPLATTLAVARAARAGVVVRGGEILERVGEADLAFFDKTGTLTEGRPQLKGITLWDPQVTKEELLGRLAGLEGASEHVLGKAVLEEARKRGVAGGDACEVEVFPGRGMSGTVTWHGEKKRVTAGSVSFVRDHSLGAFDDEDGTTIEVAWEGRVRGRLTFRDVLHRSAGACLARLAAGGIPSVLLSGDNAVAAAEIAGRLAMERVAAPRTPEEKVQEVRAAAAAGRRTIMVGDGINDAAALAAAGTGIALGGGTELARTSAAVVVLSDDLLLVPWLVELGRRTRGIIRANFAWSFGYNAVALAAAALGRLHPLIAALAMVFSSLTVLANSSRISAFPQHSEPST
ncbi:cadmium-translocating P-type ATPase [Geomonas sp. RF6]|uniref:heavy metal translocating P-type ATPase n=1 Tax=Geomonas sp. RF6 TaxID=2897342 RepID=UPI001E4EE088|nr:cation-translocating P-type ATPase [Geomonas sp. RF6]UFS72138.1 cadmium-translocating P-type ATPase [Geomonas sp. RF6]